MASPPVYYEDVVDQVGYVPAGVREGRFELYEHLDARHAIEVPLPESFELTVLNAARDQKNARVRVKGRGAFDASGRLLRFVEVESIGIVSADQSGEIDNTALLRSMETIATDVSNNDLDEIPIDAAARLDKHLRRGIR